MDTAMYTEVNKTEAASRGHVLLRLEKVMEMTGKTRNQLYISMRKGVFPRPVKIGNRAAAWVHAEVQSWISARIAARDAAVALATDRTTAG